MKSMSLLFGSMFGFFSVVLGAFGAHAFKKILPVDRLESFETGVRYQMYTAFFLLIIGFFLNFQSQLERWVALLMIMGCVLFSGSIYLLSFQEVWKLNLRFLGPVTPLGGALMILSWALLGLFFLKTPGVGKPIL